MYNSELSIEEFNTKIKLRHDYVITHKNPPGVNPENAANLATHMGDDSTPNTWKGDGSFFLVNRE